MARFTASEHLAAFFDGLRATGTELHGSNAQLTYLIRDALDNLSPDSDLAVEDAATLSSDLEVIGEALLYVEQEIDEDADGTYAENDDDEDD